MIYFSVAHLLLIIKHLGRIYNVENVLQLI